MKAEGTTVTGSVDLGDHGQGRIENGKLDEDEIAFEVVLDTGELTYRGTVAGDEMHRTVTGTTGNR